MKSRAKKVTSLHSAPPILSIHLKRFSASGMRKNTLLIQYPEELDLNPYMSEESRGIPKYRLIATVCHQGFDFSGMSSGHYTANCKSASGIWHNFDDIRVFFLTSIVCNRIDLEGAIERGVERPRRLYFILCKR
jgi:ubiquitin C-terminal hydrolase